MGFEELLVEVENVDNYNSPTGENDFTWSFDDFGFEYRMNCYCIQQAIKEIDKHYFVYDDDNSADFEIDVDKNATIIISGMIVFHQKSKNYTLVFDHKVSTITLSTKKDVSKMKDYFENYIKFNNPLKRKNLQVYAKGGDITIAYHPITPVKWETLIIDPAIKNQIWENTIFQMENLDLNNGLIFHGIPGSGKSLTCKSLIYEAITKGYSSCYVSSLIDFTQFGLFLRKYLSPCLVVFEDIDSYAGSREDKDNPELSNFLQLISGLSDDENKIIFIATTNFLKNLDDAIKSRPMRFNRKFLFDYPAPTEIDAILDFFFKKSLIQNF